MTCDTGGDSARFPTVRMDWIATSLSLCLSPTPPVLIKTTSSSVGLLVSVYDSPHLPVDACLCCHPPACPADCLPAFPSICLCPRLSGSISLPSFGLFASPLAWSMPDSCFPASLMSPQAVLSHNTQSYPLASAPMETTLLMMPGNYSLTVTSQGLQASITLRSGGSYAPAPHLQNMCPCLQQ